MATLSLDTDPRSEAAMIGALRSLDSAQKLARVFSLRATTLALARSRIRETYADASDAEVRLRLASLWLDRETMRRVYDWDPGRRGY